MKAFLAVMKKELTSVLRDRTILIAIVIQLFIASFSSALLIGMLSLYDADSAGLYANLQIDVALIGEDTALLTGYLADRGVRAISYATLEQAEADYYQGKVRAIGVCNFGQGDLSELLQIGQFESNQLPYSLLWRGIEFDLRQMCADSGLSILCYSPLSQALLTGKFASADDVPDGRARTRHFSKQRPQTRHGEDGFESETFAAVGRVSAIGARIGVPMAQLALAWLLHQPGVTTVLSGARRPEQIRENARASSLELSATILRELEEATDKLKVKLGSNLDQYQTAAESRFR